jgi:putative phosphotransacetylase
MERDKIVSMVVQEVVRAMAQGGGAGVSSELAALAASAAGNARTRASVLDHSQGIATRFDNLKPREGESTSLDVPAAIIGVSNRHIHISAEHCAQLFGPGRDLSVRNMLRQTGEYAARETLTVITHRGRSIQDVRILGPLRGDTQVELSRTDCFYLGIKGQVRNSGDIEGTPGIILVGPKGAVILEKGVIIAGRHIHAPPQWAQRWGLNDQQVVSCRAGSGGAKPTVLENVLLRVKPSFVLEAHLDTDDANAACVGNEDLLEVIL